MPVAFLQLTAVNPELNINRYYDIEIAQDLVNDWIIITYFGAVNGAGQRKQYGFQSFDEMLNRVKAILRKRFNEKTNNGAYSLVSLYVQPDLRIIEDVIKEAFEQEAYNRFACPLTVESQKVLNLARYKYQLRKSEKKLSKHKIKPTFPLWET